DVPAVRHGHLNELAHFEYGLTRSAHVGDGRVVVLVPKGDAERRKDHLGHVADEHRRNLGEKPDRLVVFEYEIDARRMRGTLRRLADVDGKEPFTADYGYYEAKVTDLNSLKKFLAPGRSVTYAQRLNAGGVILGGRQTLSREYRGLS